jgi:hypothetical protein
MQQIKLYMYLQFIKKVHYSALCLCYSHTPVPYSLSQGSIFIPEYYLQCNIIINGYLDNTVVFIAEEE